MSDPHPGRHAGLIDGATGAAGRLAVRIARHLGAVRSIATGRNTEVLGSLHADVEIPLVQANEAVADAFRHAFASGVDIVPSTISRQIARLEELALVERRIGATDRRSREALATRAGKVMARRIDAAREHLTKAALAD